MRSLVIGMGEIGSALYNIINEKVGFASAYDINGSYPPPENTDFLHICYPYYDSFVEDTLDYIARLSPKFTVIHSSLPVGTTAKISGAYHSPVRGKHPNMIEGLLNYVKYVGYELKDYENVVKILDYFDSLGIAAKSVAETKNTELMKLLALGRYGTYIAFAKEQEAICEHYGCKYEQVVIDFEKTRNEGITDDLKQPLLYPFKDYVGGHCTVEDMELLLNDKEFPLLKQAYDIDRGTKIWGNSNIFKTAKIGKGCSIGQFCEIGHNVKIGNNVRIGAFTFIPEGVTIEDNCFIAPKVTFSNDKKPPSAKECWGKILIKKGAIIGMGSIILPGVTIGESSMVGAGSIVTKDIPAGELWYGNAAYSHGKVEK